MRQLAGLQQRISIGLDDVLAQGHALDFWNGPSEALERAPHPSGGVLDELLRPMAPAAAVVLKTGDDKEGGFRTANRMFGPEFRQRFSGQRRILSGQVMLDQRLQLADTDLRFGLNW